MKCLAATLEARPRDVAVTSACYWDDIGRKLVGNSKDARDIDSGDLESMTFLLACVSIKQAPFINWPKADGCCE
jgi:hypothetical protein